MLVTAGVGLLVVLVMMTLVCLVSRYQHDVSIVDPLWGVAFLVLSLTYVVREETSGSRAWLMLVLVGVWALRLFGYLVWRRQGEPEDYRYAAMRERSGPSFATSSLFRIFWLQGVLAWIISAPLLAVADRGGDVGLLDVVALGVWGIGFFFETVGDLQLARFKADESNIGQVMDQGLWSYTRHPNYFGDFTVWWAYYLLALAAGGWWAFFGPLLMSFLLIKVSGVSLLEKRLQSSRPGYAGYAARTNAFFPRFRGRSGRN